MAEPRFRITVRSAVLELRGHADGFAAVLALAAALEPLGAMVVASDWKPPTPPTPPTPPDSDPDPEINAYGVRLPLRPTGNLCRCDVPVSAENPECGWHLLRARAERGYR